MPPAEDPKRSVSTVLKDSTLATIDVMAKRTGKNRSAYIRWALEEHARKGPTVAQTKEVPNPSPRPVGCGDFHKAGKGDNHCTECGELRMYHAQFDTADPFYSKIEEPAATPDDDHAFAPGESKYDDCQTCGVAKYRHDMPV